MKPQTRMNLASQVECRTWSILSQCGGNSGLLHRDEPYFTGIGTVDQSVFATQAEVYMQYSRTSFERPPLLQAEIGRSRQVAAHRRPRLKKKTF